MRQTVDNTHALNGIQNAIEITIKARKAAHRANAGGTWNFLQHSYAHLEAIQNEALRCPVFTGFRETDA
jgi:hypothetical protein